jgi:hypothetical protein
MGIPQAIVKAGSFKVGDRVLITCTEEGKLTVAVEGEES